MTRKKKVFSAQPWTQQLKFAQACQDSNVPRMQQLIQTKEIWKETILDALSKSAETLNLVSFQYCLAQIEYFDSVDKFWLLCEKLVRKENNEMLHLLLEKQKFVELCRLDFRGFSNYESFHLQQYRYTLQRVVELAILSNDQLLVERVFQLDGLARGFYLDCFANFIGKYLWHYQWEKQHVPFVRLCTKKLYCDNNHWTDRRFCSIYRCFNESVSFYNNDPQYRILHAKRQRQTQLIMFDQDATNLALGLAHLGLPRLLLCHLTTSCSEPFGNLAPLHDLWMIFGIVGQ